MRRRRRTKFREYCGPQKGGGGGRPSGSFHSARTEQTRFFARCSEWGGGKGRRSGCVCMYVYVRGGGHDNRANVQRYSLSLSLSSFPLETPRYMYVHCTCTCKKKRGGGVSEGEEAKTRPRITSEKGRDCENILHFSAPPQAAADPSIYQSRSSRSLRHRRRLSGAGGGLQIGKMSKKKEVSFKGKREEAIGGKKISCRAVYEL